MSLSRLSSAADRTTYLASRRKGSSVGCSPRTVRVSLTLTREAFAQLRSRADQHHRSISRQAARLLVRALAEDRGSIPVTPEGVGKNLKSLPARTGAAHTNAKAVPPFKNSALAKEDSKNDDQGSGD